MQWYYSKNGTQLGPVPQGELISKLASGEVSASDLVWKEGMGDWVPASQVGELAVVATGPAPTSQTFPTGASSPSPAAPHAPMIPPSSGKATASMVLGIVSVVFGLCGCYGFVIAIPCGVLAIVFGGQFKKILELNPVLTPELGKAKAGIIMGWIGVGLALLLTIGMIVFGVASGAMQSMQP